MTTTAEVKRWAIPILERHTDLILNGRNLILKPVQHLLRGIYFDSSWSKDYPRPYWYFVMLFKVPTSSIGFRWSGEILAGRSTESAFAEKLMLGATDKIENELRTVQSIEEFEQYTKYEKDVLGLLGYWAIERYPRYNSVLLSALGRLEEAHRLLSGLIEKDEARYLVELAEGRAVIAKRANSRLGKNAVESATCNLAIIAELKRLLALLEARDRPGIGALLREWEQHNAKRWRVEHLWEPTPFRKRQDGPV